MRTFLAIDLPLKVKAKISKLQSNLREEILNYLDFEEEKALSKWVKEENLHLTLIFLGNINPNKELHYIKDLCSQVAQDFKPFELKIEKTVLAPSNFKLPRMIWLTFLPSPELFELRELLAKSLSKIIYLKKEDFLPHLTLVRFRTFYLKRFWPEDFPPKEKLEKELNLSFKVEGFKLFESKLLPKGPEYKALASFNFGLI